jgi:predicted lysophospholipase L1 biosynthesis ABC-type transport system permease subunit
LSIVGTTDFIAGMIVQHEQVAARLRAQLRRHEAGVSQNLGASRAAVRLPNS